MEKLKTKKIYLFQLKQKVKNNALLNKKKDETTCMKMNFSRIFFML